MNREAITTRLLAELKPVTRQVLPKKIVVTEKFDFDTQGTPFSKAYDKPFNLLATMWVADVPYSKIPPKIALTLSMGGRWFRLIFNSTGEIKCFLKRMKGFVGRNTKVLTRALKEAQRDQIEMKQYLNRKKYLKKNDITTIPRYTTIQGIMLTNDKATLLPEGNPGKARTRSDLRLSTGDQKANRDCLRGNRVATGRQRPGVQKIFGLIDV